MVDPLEYYVPRCLSKAESNMDLPKIMSELHERRKLVDEAIANLEALAKLVPARRKRGRPRKNNPPVPDEETGSK